MNVSEIMDAELRYLAIQGSTLAIRLLATAELDRRAAGKDRPYISKNYEREREREWI
jgi:hypothetical protein